jgi:hypothetical protein
LKQPPLQAAFFCLRPPPAARFQLAGAEKNLGNAASSYSSWVPNEKILYKANNYFVRQMSLKCADRL